MNTLEQAIKELKKGNDTSIRLYFSECIEDVINKSNEGEIGWGDFIGEIRHNLDGMEKICKTNYKE
jgi:hypothetical protein